MGLFPSSTFNGRTSGSASQPLGYRPSKDQGSTVNRREAEAKHQGLAKGTCNEGAKHLLKLGTKHEDHLEQIFVFFCNAW